MTILFPQTIVEKGGGSYPNNCSILFISKGKGSGLISLLNYIFLTQGNMRHFRHFRCALKPTNCVQSTICYSCACVRVHKLNGSFVGLQDTKVVR